MSDAAPDPADATAPDRDGSPSSPADRLLDLQALDSRLDQLAHRRANLPEQQQLDEASSALAEWEATRARHEAGIGRLADEITAAEARTDDLGAQKERLEAQLKTVIAPREAEALMHEISTLDAERDEIETNELEALEEQARIEGALADHLILQSARRDSVEQARSVVDAAVAQIDAEIGQAEPERDAARTTLDATTLAGYDRLRSHHQIAVAALEGRRCTGCHLDLSAAEIDEANDEAAAASGVATCPQCGRMLVV